MLAFGTVPTSPPVQGLRTSSLRGLSTRSPAMRMVSCRGAAASDGRASFIAVVGGSGEMVEGEVEGVEIAPAPGGQVRRRPVGDQRHLLLGGTAVRAQRRVEAGEVMAAPAAADHRQALRNDDQVADAVGRKLETLAGLVARQD